MFPASSKRIKPDHFLQQYDDGMTAPCWNFESKCWKLIDRTEAVLDHILNEQTSCELFLLSAFGVALQLLWYSCNCPNYSILPPRCPCWPKSLANVPSPGSSQPRAIGDLLCLHLATSRETWPLHLPPLQANTPDQKACPQIVHHRPQRPI